MARGHDDGGVYTYAVRDENGLVICHGARQVRGALNNSAKRVDADGFTQRGRAYAYVETFWREVGAVRNSWATCATCEQNTRDYEVGHVIADANGGVFCPCNLVPQCRACNESVGVHTWVPSVTADPRAAFARWGRLLTKAVPGDARVWQP